MRVKLTKALKIALAALLVFLVAAPLIVGVYDAANIQTDRSSNAVVGSIVQQSGYDGGDEYSHDAESAGMDGSRRDEQGMAGDQGQAEEQAVCSIDDWYSGDPVASDLLGSGDAHLVYEFADGSVVDFGNPYVLDWSDVPMPADYDQVVSGDDGSFSPFAPDKAYAGPISWIGNKLKMLAVKSGYWKSFNSMLYSAAITICMSTGLNYTAATQAVNKVVAELPAITRVISSETAVFTSEDTAMLVSNSIARVAARKVAASEFPAALNAEIAANVTAVETTGMLAGGASGNFINAMYQLAATGGVPASILFSDIGLYIGSWLGGQFEGFSDLPSAEPDSYHATLGDFDLDFGVVDGPMTGSTSYIPAWSSSVSSGLNIMVQGYYDGIPVCYGFPSGTSTDYIAYIYSPSSDRLQLNSWGSSRSLYYWSESRNAWVSQYASIKEYDFATLKAMDGYLYGVPGTVQTLYFSSFYDFSVKCSGVSDFLSWNAESQTFSGVEVVPGTSSVGFFAGQIIGQDAAYDDAGNVTDYGNVTVPNVTVDGYVAPSTYAEALNQMNATATVENPAHADSPSFGQGDTTIKDWVDSNQTPKPEPGDESSQDGFRVEDLEKVFPFCIPWDLYYLLSAFAAEPVAPHISWPFDFGELGKFDLDIDLAEFEPVAEVVRTCEAVLFCIGLAFATRGLVRG